MSTRFSDNSDDAISGFADDLLQRTPFVDRLAAILKAAPERSSSVFALYGEWGSGKTSVKNLLLKRFAKDTDAPLVVEFNPWEFSSQGELLKAFFSEIAKALGRKDAGEVAVALARLGSYFSVGATALKSLQLAADVALLPGGGVIGLGADMLAAGGERAKQYSTLLKDGKLETLKEVRAQLHRALSEFDRPILIIIDDLDRLPPPQVVQILQVIRINASMPKLNFLLLMDHDSVMRALVAEKFSGDYLEKIVQFAINLPAISNESLKRFLERGLKEVLGKPAPDFDWERWHEAHAAALANILDTPRKVRRLLHTFHFQLTIFADENVPEVDLVDLFCVEVLRLYMPDVWEALSHSFIALFGQTDVADYIAQQEGDETNFTKRLKQLAALAPQEQTEACKKLLAVLLPSSTGSGSEEELMHLGTCRLCTDIHFPSYFLLTTNDAYPTQKELVTAKGHLGDGSKLLATLRQLVRKYDYRRMLAKLQPSLAAPIQAPAVERLLAAIWRLAEEDSAQYELAVDVPNDFVTETFTTFLLRQIEDDAIRQQTALNAYATSRALFPLFRFAAHELYTHQNDPHLKGDLAFSEASLKTIQKACLAELHVVRDKKRLHYHRRLGALMSYWRLMEGEEAVRSWVTDQSADDNALVAICVGLLGVSMGTRRSNGKAVETRRYYIGRKSAERVFTLDDKLRERLTKLDRTGLTKMQDLAVNEVLRNIEQKAKGIAEADYGLPD